jgi:hypothetical protein
MRLPRYVYALPVGARNDGHFRLSKCHSNLTANIRKYRKRNINHSLPA